MRRSIRAEEGSGGVERTSVDIHAGRWCPDMYLLNRLNRCLDFQ
jgi:hypothetical protein